MTRREKLWRVGAALFGVINFGGMLYAAAVEEQLHTAVHVGLLILGLGGYVVWRLSTLQRPESLPSERADERLDYLQQSVDAIALEVERIGEAQRFTDKLRSGQGEPLTLKKEQ